MAKRKRRQFGTSGANALKATPSLFAEEPIAVQPDQQYVAGIWYGGESKTIAAQQTDRTAPEVSFDTYRAMLNDPEVSSAIRALVAMALADGVQLLPAAGGDPVASDAPEFGRAEEVAVFCERNLKGLNKPLRRSLEQLAEGALVYGHKAAEIVWKIGTGQDRNRLMLDGLSIKPHTSLDFVVDQFWNLLGYRARRGVSAAQNALLPAAKFWLITLHEEDDDPRGRSSLRPAYNGWTFKQLVWPEYKRWLDNCALPSIVGKTAPKQPGDVQRNADGQKSGNKLLSPAEAMLQALTGLKNASVAVIPSGAEVDQLSVVGEGAGFERAINIADSQITKSILYQNLATNEAEFGTRAQSQTHMEVLDLLVWWLKEKLAESVGELLKRVITYNYGEQALSLTPIVSFGDTERKDWGTDATAAATLEPALTDSQWSAVTLQLGLPAPLPGERPRREGGLPTESPVTPTPPPQESLQTPRQKRARAYGSFVSLRRIR